MIARLLELASERAPPGGWSTSEQWYPRTTLPELLGVPADRIDDNRLYRALERLLAHILVCFLADVLWKTLAQLCQSAGLGDEPRSVLVELSEIRLVDVILPTREGIEIRQRCITRPTEHQQILLDHLGLRLPAKIIQTEM